MLDSSNQLEQSAPAPAKPTKTLVIQSELDQYTVNPQPIASTAVSRYYLCQNQDQEWRILNIAATVADNPTIDYIADILRILANESAKQEKSYHDTNVARVSYFGFRNELLRIMRRQNSSTEFSDSPPTAEELEAINREIEATLNRRLHFDLLFPSLVENFTSSEGQGRRQINILSFTDMDAREFMPLTQIMAKNQRVDLKTSAWIIGRMLKLLGFVIMSRVSASFTPEKFLLGPEKHHLMLLDWVNAHTVFGSSVEDVNLNILRIGQCGLDLIGATYDQKNWEYAYPLEENEYEYIDFLHRMATLSGNFYRSYDDALVPHRLFYSVVDRAWGKAYHPFTTFPK